jgi:hypothetical protein
LLTRALGPAWTDLNLSASFHPCQIPAACRLGLRVGSSTLPVDAGDAKRHRARVVDRARGGPRPWTGRGDRSVPILGAEPQPDGSTNSHRQPTAKRYACKFALTRAASRSIRAGFLCPDFASRMT